MKDLEAFLNYFGGLISSLDENPHQFNLEKYEAWEQWAGTFSGLAHIIANFSRRCMELKDKEVIGCQSKPIWSAMQNVPHEDVNDIYNFINNVFFCFNQIPQFPTFFKYDPAPNFENCARLADGIKNTLREFERQCVILATNTENKKELLNAWKLRVVVARLTVDPTNKTNWENLPKEIREICLASMGLNERFGMRRMALNEKLIVDKIRFDLDKISFDNSSNLSMKVYEKDETAVATTPPLTNEAFFESLVFLLKNAKRVETIDYNSIEVVNEEQLSHARQLITALSAHPPTGVVRFNFSIFGDMSVPIHLLQNCSMNMDSISVENCTFRPIWRTFTDIPQFVKARKIEFSSRHYPDSDYRVLTHFLGNWINNDAPIGSIVEYVGIFDADREYLIITFNNEYRREPLNSPDNPFATVFEMRNPAKIVLFEECDHPPAVPKTRITVCDKDQLLAPNRAEIVRERTERSLANVLIQHGNFLAYVD